MTTEITEAGFLDFKCPYCGEMNSFPDNSAGLLRECLNCMESLIVPEAGSEVGRKLPLPITTPRLTLRRFDARDWKDLLEFQFDGEEDAMQWLEKDRYVKLTSLDQTFSLGVEVRDGGKIIGCLGLRFADRDFLQAEIIVSGNADAQYRGFAREAIDGLFGFCFAELKLHRIFARCDSTDAVRCELFEEAGMRREGEFRKIHHVNGEWLSEVWFAVLEEEYLERGDGRSEPPAN